MDKLLEKLPFLTANRFWAIVLIAAANYLKTVGFTLDAEALATALQVIAGGHVVVRTYDRGWEKSGNKDTK